MKSINLLGMAALLIASCSLNDKKPFNADSVAVHTADTVKTQPAVTNNPSAVSSFCFLRTEGKKNTDSTVIELVLKDQKVYGQMNWMPYQKDSRRGALEGTAKGDTINAVWSFMQEGMQDTLNVKFVLKNNALFQKPLKMNVKTGRDQTDESAGYTVTYRQSGKLPR
ncbi:hypothetical protein [Mucilaginibacter xinganensis]|nr:hypothetical protein [Mucilaginibacter xinganensis]